MDKLLEKISETNDDEFLLYVNNVINADISYDKKRFLIWNDSYKSKKIVGFFIDMEKEEKKKGYDITKFSENEYISFIKRKCYSGDRAYAYIRFHTLTIAYVKYLFEISDKEFITRYDLPKFCNIKTTQIPEYFIDKEVRYFSDDTYEKIRNIISLNSMNPEYELAMVSLLYRGLKTGEIINLTYDDVDFKNKTIKINDRILDINDEIIHDILNVRNIEGIIGRFGKVEKFEKSNYVIKRLKSFDSVIYARRSINKRISGKITPIVKRSGVFDGKFNVESLYYSSKFNYMKKCAEKDNIDFIDMITHVINDKKPNKYADLYNKYYIKYRGSSKNRDATLNVERDYGILIESIKNGVVY